jgi:cob(I)alamin adenosyltransferase
MVRLTRIYTRTGDAGLTGLASGERVAKYDLRVAAYGAVDETNACLGLARLHLKDDAVLDGILARAQNDLFDLGADLATTGEQPGALRIVDSQVSRLEREIDLLNGALSPLNSFILPGGSPAAAHLHLARTVCRRAERDAVELASGSEARIGAPALKYLNRLSDLLFVAARWANDKGKADVLWAPAATRDPA